MNHRLLSLSEHVAKAIEAADEDGLLPPFVMGIHERLARAAIAAIIAAMRKPTPEMIAVGSEYLNWQPKPEAALMIWVAMVDEMSK